MTTSEIRLVTGNHWRLACTCSPQVIRIQYSKSLTNLNSRHRNAIDKPRSFRLPSLWSELACLTGSACCYKRADAGMIFFDRITPTASSRSYTFFSQGIPQICSKKKTNHVPGSLMGSLMGSLIDVQFLTWMGSLTLISRQESYLYHIGLFIALGGASSSLSLYPSFFLQL